MAIPEDQLTTWAQIGAQTTSKDTYATIKLALDNENAGYQGKRYSVFLQGSYGNDTNIWKESDVDVVMRLDASFTYDISSLPVDQQQSFKQTLGDATYTRTEFQQDVLAILRARFGQDVVPGTKAVMINARGNRRDADVIISLQHRKYSRYGPDGGDYVTGISFLKSDGTRIVNYPKQHRENMIAKNQATNEWFKHIVRIYKNARERMINERIIADGGAPSYYVEGLLYSVPNDNFGTSYVDSLVNTINWLAQADKTKFVCANMQYWLLRGDPDVTWNTEDCTTFIDCLVDFWNNW